MAKTVAKKKRRDPNTWGVGYKSHGVPPVVFRELKAAAVATDLPLKAAVAVLIGPPGGDGQERQDWINGLCRQIVAGQEVAGEYAGADGEPRLLSVHIPREYRTRLKEAARAVGINSAGAAGRLILVGFAGRIEAVIRERVGVGARAEVAR